MGEFTAASVEQSIGIEPANHAVPQMDEAAQQNAVLLEQAAAAASFYEQAAQLQTVSARRFCSVSRPC
ncbi:hypothetical protein [Paraburkholderia sp. DGU8]|jgi:methyl-accepting chemotaxis protein-2 (aspartate sensor receptor)|uniref:hypothetical protein n=1 Tax=Paraburkholderia sp. DGU8 TaxID=3161997 RepID=UPI003466921D